ncbi:MAG: O-antigen ligase family protein, partial [Flammeovirgaceae bacterium]
MFEASKKYFVSHDLSVYLFSNLTEAIDSHPTYFAYYLIFAITWGLYMLYYEIIKFSIYFGVAALVFLIAMLILTGGQTSFVSILLIFSFFTLKYTLEKKTKRDTIVFSFIVIMIISIFSFISVLQNNERFHSLANQNDYWERMILWESAVKANSRPLTGEGTGDYMDVLNEYYRSHGLSQFAEGNLNSHNQYVQMYLTHGLLGLISFILLLAKPLYTSLKIRDPLCILLFFP